MNGTAKWIAAIATVLGLMGAVVGYVESTKVDTVRFEDLKADVGERLHTIEADIKELLRRVPGGR